MAAGWQELGEPATPAEADALAAVRALLPDDAVTHAWSSLTFIDTQGRTAEIDLLLLTKAGFFVVELKGWHGRISGSQQSWRVAAPNGQVRNERNPLFATDLKAKRLKSLLLDRAPDAKARKSVPFIQPLVVLHGKGSVIALDETAQSSVVALDGYSVKGLARSLSDVLRTPPESMHHQIDGPGATQIRTLLKNVGFVPTPKNRMVGQYSLEKADPISEGPTWQDLLAVHPSVPSVQRRLRVFDIPPGSAAEVRADIERAARREFVLTQGVTHDGIARPTELITEPVPALIFEYSPTEVPLTNFLVESGPSLGLSERLGLIRQLAGILRYAHQRRLMHRALTPRQIFVETSAEPPRLVVRDWQTGRRHAAVSSGASSTAAPAPSLTSVGTGDVRALIGHADWVYLAPEAHHDAAELPAIPLDVYGLGAVSYLLLTGEPPASNHAELLERLETNGALDPQVADPTIADPLADLVRHATSRVEASRTASIDEVLAALDAAEDALTAPPAETPPEERPRAVDPLTAARGEIIADRFIVKEHRGQGSTGTALLVDDYDRERPDVILKIARDDAATRRLHDEAEVLAQLDHPRIVRLLEPPLTVDGRLALLLSDAGKATLAGRLSSTGRATLGELERFGGDLLDAVAHLDARGLFHRDIKPANLGIQADPGTRKPHLVLFDLSLAREPVDNVTSGTRGYVDPYLSLPMIGSRAPRRRYDRAAELYAVAATLFEMATTTLPWWSDGDLGPASASDRVVLAPDMFEASIAEPMQTFFATAFAPAAADRFGDLATMAHAWWSIFAEVDAPGAEETESARDEAAGGATLDTPLAASGLSARALSALARVQATTVGELLRTPPMQINSIPGLGEQIRKEVQSRIREWRSRLQRPDATPNPRVPTAGADRSIERFLGALVPRATTANATEVAALRVLLGSPSPAGAAQALPDAGPWPSATDLAPLVGVTRARVSQIVDKAATRWAKLDEITAVRAELRDALGVDEGVATIGELSASILLRHGSTAEGADRHRRAAGLVRAGIEADQRSGEPEFVVRRPRGDGPVLIALAGEQGHGEALLADAARLGETAAKIVAAQAVVPASVARARLRAVEVRTAQLSDDRILRLAAAAAGNVELSSLHELYRLDVDHQIAAATALRGAAGTSLAEAGIRKRVANRFPALPPLPARPALDTLVAEAVPGLRWDGTAYSRPTSASSAATSTSMTTVATEPADIVDSHLRGSLARSSALTLCVHPRAYQRATTTLSALYGATPVDVSARLLAAVRDLAAGEGIDWPLVLQSDAEPSGGDWENLRGLVTDAMTAPWQEILAAPRPLLLVNAAPLARYGLTSWLSDLLDQSQHRPAARWLLVPRRGHQAAPTLDGFPVPLGADRWIDLPHDLATLQSGVPS